MMGRAHLEEPVAVVELDVVRIAVVGDYQPEHETHPATTDALGHAADHLGVRAGAEWIGTDEVQVAGDKLFDYHGIWIAPGSPYRSLDGALHAITAARTTGIPLLGTCAGFQHIIVEFARNVLGVRGAQHAEYNADAESLFITPLSCSLAGQTFTVQLVSGSRARAAYGAAEATEQYYCNFGLNADRRVDLEAAGLVTTGTDDEGEARIVELPQHPFFLGTLFVPQVSSTRDRPHALVTAFIAAALRRRTQPSGTETTRPAG